MINDVNIMPHKRMKTNVLKTSEMFIRTSSINNCFEKALFDVLTKKEVNQSSYS